MPIDKSPIIVKEFKGKLVTDADQVTGGIDDISQIKIPFEYATRNQNLIFLKKGGMRTRDGIEKYVRHSPYVGTPVQMWRIDILNDIPQVDRWLILTWDGGGGGGGRLYDTGSTVGNPILNIATMNYAYVLNAFGKMYITPWSAYAEPISNQFVYVYNGLYVARVTKAAVPVPGAMAVAAAAGGSCTAGLHYLSVLFETDTGYIGVPPPTHLAPPYGTAPYTPLSVTITAANAIASLTNIPVGAAGTGVIKRHIIMTKVVVNPPLFAAYASGLLGFEPFIVFTINDNVTTVATISIPDSGLLDSAKNYLIDSATIPACIALAQYSNRMVYIGPKPTVAIESSILVSLPNRPEQVKTLTTPTGIAASPYRIDDVSTIYIAPSYSGKVMAGAELNGVFYVFKEDSTWGIVAENDKDPAEWTEPACIDSGKGAFPFGVADVGNNPSNNNDSSLIVCGNHGISFFNGKFAQRSLAESIWEDYRVNDLKWSKVLVEPIRQLIFLRIGDPYGEGYYHKGSLIGGNNEIFVANYYYGVEITNIRWGGWKYPNDHTGAVLNLVIRDIALRAPGTVGNDGAVGTNFNTNYSLLCLLELSDSAIRIYSEALYDRDFYVTLGANAIFPEWYNTSGYTPNDEGIVYSFGPLKIRFVAGHNTGILTPLVRVRKYDLDGVATAVEVIPAGFTPAHLPGKYYSFNLNHISEHLKIELYGQSRVLIDQLILYRTEVAKDRPRV